jgi:hypothetical protein
MSGRSCEAPSTLLPTEETLRRQPSLRSQLNQIRLWVRQGRTDAWIAHKLDIGVDDLARFKREHQLDEDETSSLKPADPLSVEAPEPSYEIEEEEEEEEDEDAEDARPRSRERTASRRGRSRPPRRREPRTARDEEPVEARRDSSPAERVEGSEDADGEPRPRRRRGRRGGRRHRARRNAFEATFDHGEEGYGLWLDPAVVDNPVYSEHWAGHRTVTVTLEADSITIRRARPGAPGSEDEAGEDENED